MKNTHGGAGRGQGRKPKHEELAIAKTVRFPQSYIDAIEGLGINFSDFVVGAVGKALKRKKVN